MKEKDDQRSPAHAVRKVNLKKNATEETDISIKLKLSAASCGESSILKKQYHSSFARYRIQSFSFPFSIIKGPMSKVPLATGGD